MDAIRAIIDAAYIQGFLGFFGALIGAVALIISIRIAAKNTLNEIKSEKVAESKRDQYIDLTDSYTRYLVSSLRLPLSNSNAPFDGENQEKWDLFESKYFELIGCLNKVNLITTSEIRLELHKLEQEIHSYQQKLLEFYWRHTEKPKTTDLEDHVFEFAKLLRKDLGISEDSELEAELINLRNEKKNQ